MAKNYMADVAKMLGVELEEEFELTNWQDYTFKLTENNLMAKSKNFSKDSDYKEAHNILHGIILGNYEIIKLSWEPKKNEEYYSYYIDINGEWHVRLYYFDNTSIYHYMRVALGIVYKTSEGAEHNLEKHREEIMLCYHQDKNGK